MPLHEITEYWVDCDECSWAAGNFPDSEFALQQLDAHITEKH